MVNANCNNFLNRCYKSWSFDHWNRGKNQLYLCSLFKVFRITPLQVWRSSNVSWTMVFCWSPSQTSESASLPFNSIRVILDFPSWEWTHRVQERKQRYVSLSILCRSFREFCCENLTRWVSTEFSQTINFQSSRSFKRVFEINHYRGFSLGGVNRTTTNNTWIPQHHFNFIANKRPESDQSFSNSSNTDLSVLTGCLNLRKMKTKRNNFRGFSCFRIIRIPWWNTINVYLNSKLVRSLEIAFWDASRLSKFTCLR